VGDAGGVVDGDGERIVVDGVWNDCERTQTETKVKTCKKTKEARSERGGD